ncbi:MAG: hypothetical protein PQJ58_15915 [Spirochaetales bacterium]|nr:hypothetical protein [Spirochaetales bacterium]
MKKTILVLSLCLLGLTAWAGEIPSGTWMQTASTAGDADVSITVMEVTDRIIAVEGSNGWKGFAWYDEARDRYKGFFELVPNSANPMAKWRNRVFQMELKYDGLTLTLEGMSDDIVFAATYWNK